MYIDISMIIGKNVLPKVFTNISHVPKIAKNLFLVNKITLHGHIFEFENKKCIIKNMHKEVVGQGMWENWLFKL
jgi:sRNA-binding regulator protein Hfq